MFLLFNAALLISYLYGVSFKLPLRMCWESYELCDEFLFGNFNFDSGSFSALVPIKVRRCLALCVYFTVVEYHLSSRRFFSQHETLPSDSFNLDGFFIKCAALGEYLIWIMHDVPTKLAILGPVKIILTLVRLQTHSHFKYSLNRLQIYLMSLA